MQTVGPETSFKAGLGAMEIACSAMEIAATQTLCEDEASLKAGLEGMEMPLILLLKAACLWSCIFACVCSHSLCIKLPWPTLLTIRYLIYISFCYPIGCAATGSVPCQRNT